MLPVRCQDEICRRDKWITSDIRVHLKELEVLLRFNVVKRARSICGTKVVGFGSAALLFDEHHLFTES